MSTFAERLKAAKEAPRPHEDVVVALDAHVSEQFERLRQELEQARQEYAKDIRLAEPAGDVEAVQEKLDALREAATDSLVKLRFYRLPGDTWTEITDQCPVRPGVLIDENYGYNMQKAIRLAAPISGVRVEGEEEIPLVVQKPTQDQPGLEAIDEWADLFATISGAEAELIRDAIYSLNVYEPTMRVAQLKKDSVARPA